MKPVAIAHRQPRKPVEVSLAQRALHGRQARRHDAGDAMGEKRRCCDGRLHAGGRGRRFCGRVGDEDEGV